MATFTRTELKQEARQVLRLQKKTFVLTTLVFFVIALVINALGGSGSEHDASAFTALMACIAVVVEGVLTIGFSSMSLKALADKQVDVGGLFDGFADLGKALLLVVAYTAIVAVGTLFLVVPGIILGLGFAQAYYIYLENPSISVSDALSESWRMMRGHKWEYFVLQLSFILWGLLGTITLGLAYLWVFPYMQLTYAAYYNRIKPQTIAGSAMNDATAGQHIMSEQEAREAISAVMNSNVDAPVIDEEVVVETPSEDDAPKAE